MLQKVIVLEVCFFIRKREELIMAWCPKCKTEYQDNITTCADCGTNLVAELKEEATECIARIVDQDQAEKFIDFLKYSKLSSATIQYNTKEDLYYIYTTKSEEQEANKLFVIFRSKIEEEELLSNTWTQELSNSTIITEPKNDNLDPLLDDTDSKDYSEEEDTVKNLSSFMPERSVSYVDMSLKYEDLKSTALIFTISGILGVLFTILNVTHVLSIFNNWFQFTVLFLACGAFIIIGIRSSREAKEIFPQIAKEKKNREEIEHWMDEHISKNDINSQVDSSVSSEVSFLQKTEFMKREVLKAFPDMNDAFLDYIIEEYYNSHFE